MKWQWLQEKILCNSGLIFWQKQEAKPVGAIKYNIDRMETVIKTAAEKSGWGTKKDVSQGFSVYFSHIVYVAQVCEVVMERKTGCEENICGFRLRSGN